MDIEAEANPAHVADDVSVADTGAETENSELEELESGEPEIELVEIERNGRKFSVPKELEGEFLMQSDYTKKTMSLAEERKAADAEIAATRETLRLSQADIDLAATVKSLEAQRAQYLAINPQEWAQLQATNPEEADRIERQFDRIERELFKANQARDHLKAKITSEEERQIATFHEKQIAEAARVIPNFDTRRPELEKLATEIGGYTADLMKQASAGDYRLLDLAAEGLKAREARAKAAKQQAAATAQPAAEIVKGRTPVVKPLDDRASTAAWMKARNEQAARR